MKLKKLGRAYKQLVAGVLSAAMALTGLPAFGGSTAHAAGLQNEHIQTRYTKGTPGTIPTYDSGESTAYTVGNETLNTNGDFGAAVGSTFNISAIRDASERTNATAGYNTEVKTGYGVCWWHTRYAFGPEGSVTYHMERFSTFQCYSTYSGKLAKLPC